VPIPEVTGITLAKARRQLSAAGLEVGEISRRYHPTVPEGSVFRQDPATGEAPRGSGVDLWVSRGHAPVVVPEVIGSRQDAAEEILRAAGFKVTVITAFSEDIERGRVAEISPAEGSEATFESAVTITVSIGPEHFPVPDLRGLTPTQARARADELGLEVDVFLVPGTPQTQVLSQTPTPGTTVTYGDTITLFVA
ncbi:MAG: PASTA domain-containing protein, partial [Actinomycetota bacterium]